MAEVSATVGVLAMLTSHFISQRLKEEISRLESVARDLEEYLKSIRDQIEKLRSSA